MALRIQPITNGLVGPISGSTLPVPSLATDGLDITSWRPLAPYTYSYDDATVYINANGTTTATLGDASNPVFLFGYRNGAWWDAGLVDGGTPVVLPSGAPAVARRISSIGIFSSLAIACASITGGRTYSYWFEPIATYFNA